MTDEAKRAEVAAMYPGKGWAKRVAKMSDAQVFAIWMKNQNAETKDEKNDEADPDIPF